MIYICEKCGEECDLIEQESTHEVPVRQNINGGYKMHKIDVEIEASDCCGADVEESDE